MSTETIYALTAFVCASAGAACDIRSRRIPNRLTGSSCLAALLLHGVLHGWRGVGSALAGSLLGGTVFVLFYLAGGMGAGDVKLVAAVCGLAGLSATAGILLGTALLGGVFALVVALWHQRLNESFANMGRLLWHHGARGLRPHPELNVSNPRTLRLPYGLAIAAGAGSSLCSVLLR